MLIYRFRITCEEHDAFLREIEILPNQSFLDFHHILLESAELMHVERASFFAADKGYRKKKEISLKTEKRQVRKYDEDLDQVLTETVVLPLMKNEKLKNYIEDPHQKLIYEFHGRDTFSFHIELYKIYPSEGLDVMPRCIKRSGELPRKAEVPVTPPESPSAVRPAAPRPPVPKIIPPVSFDDLVEDEEGLAAIESELDGIMKDAAELADEATGSGEGPGAQPEGDESGSEEYLYGSQTADPDDFDQLERLEDFEDIDNLDKRLSGGSDPDDY